MTTTTTPSAEILEKMRKILHYINENDVVTWHALADKHLREVLTFCHTQASLCLEQAEEIKRLRVALEFYALSWMNNQHGSLDGSPSKRLIADKGSIAKQALSQLSHDN